MARMSLSVFRNAPLTLYIGHERCELFSSLSQPLNTQDIKMKCHSSSRIFQLVNSLFNRVEKNPGLMFNQIDQKQIRVNRFNAVGRKRLGRKIGEIERDKMSHRANNSRRQNMTIIFVRQLERGNK